MMRFVLICCMALTGVLASPAFAHTAFGQTNSFAHGMAHPLGGVDHTVAMVAVGLWGVVAGGRAIVIWPIAFVSTMLAGFAAAILGLQVPFVEPAIWSSVIILAVFVALQVKAPVWVGAVIVGLFAFFHGHAHGAEATAVNVVPYATGFAAATAGLHAAGIGLGLFAEKSIDKDALRAMVGLQRWAK
jgi:urease accessory protein